MPKKLMILVGATALSASTLGANSAPAEAVCKRDPIVGLVCLSSCPAPTIDPKRPVESVEEALRPRVCPD